VRKHIDPLLPCGAIIVAIVGLVTACGTATASPEIERAELVRLIHELEQLEALIEDAETAAVSTQRVHFQYLWLRADFDKIKAGIREYLDTAPTTPRVLPPLAGDYIR